MESNAALLPNGISNPRVTAHPASTMDIFSTLVDVCGLDATFPIEPQDGRSIFPLFSEEIGERETSIPFRYSGWRHADR
ncbi:MAG: hypothetical protein CME19_20230 [Gemmatimonadetes bacterium]|nr:hypothetical protein [Gemmatimonadota bacterium]